MPGGVLEMIWRWRYFIGAAVLGAYVLLSRGAPPVAVGLGIVVAAAFMWRRASRLS